MKKMLAKIKIIWWRFKSFMKSDWAEELPTHSINSLTNNIFISNCPKNIKNCVAIKEENHTCILIPFTNY